MTSRGDSPIRALVIDDDEDAFVLVRDWLDEIEPGTYRVEWAPTADAARTAFARDAHDVYLVDFRLGAVNGLELVGELAAALPLRPAIVLTGQDGRSVDCAALEAGATEYLPKEALTAVVLERAIRYAIAQKRTQQLERERLALQESARAMERVLAIVAHELRTPLTSLQLISEYLLTPDARETAEWDHFLRTIHDETMRMTDTVNHVLEAARVDSGLARWNWGTVRLASIVEEALDSVRPQIRNEAVELASSVEPPDLTMSGDTDAVRRLLMNLVGNAVKHTKQGTIAIRACEEMQGEDRMVRLEVRDTGSGMPESVAQKLGTAFALNSGLVGSRASHGTGLGLAICKGIAAAHGGSIRVSSTEGEGSTFCAVLRGDLPGPAQVTEGTRIIRDAA